MAGAAALGIAAAAGFGSRLWRNNAENTGMSPSAAPNATPAGATARQPEATAAADGPLMAFFLLSDLHISSGIGTMSDHLRKALGEVSGTFAGKVDTLVFGGDVTDTGTDGDYKELRSILSKYKLPPIYANMGNHDYYDVWMDPNGGWSKETFPNGKTDEGTKKKFCDFWKLEKPYHDTRVKGYHIILLSQEIYQQTRKEVGEGAWYSDEQLEWLRTKLAENKDGKPVFVMIHQPLPPAGQDGGSHRVIPAKKLREILKPYPNAFVFSGHSHQDFQNGTQHYVKETFHWFHNSSVGRVLNAKYQNDKKDAAQGLYVEVYADRVVLRGREFSTGEWLPEAEWTVKLQSAKV